MLFSSFSTFQFIFSLLPDPWSYSLIHTPSLIKSRLQFSTHELSHLVLPSLCLTCSAFLAVLFHTKNGFRSLFVFSFFFFLFPLLGGGDSQAFLTFFPVLFIFFKTVRILLTTACFVYTSQYSIFPHSFSFTVPFNTRTFSFPPSYIPLFQMFLRVNTHWYIAEGRASQAPYRIKLVQDFRGEWRNDDVHVKPGHSGSVTRKFLHTVICAELPIQMA